MSLNISLSVRHGAIISLVGFLLSAPVALILVQLIAPQPAWSSAEAFVTHFHDIQTIPYYFGFILISGMFLLVLAHKQDYMGRDRTTRIELQLAFGLILIFTTLISFNYICQTTFIPMLVKENLPQNHVLIAAFSMSNPRSLSWAIEMWGYLFLAKALWLLRGYYRSKKSLLPQLFTLNLLFSLTSVVWTIVNPVWVESVVGLALYLAWNMLMILILVLILKHTRLNAERAGS